MDVLTIDPETILAALQTIPGSQEAARLHPLVDLLDGISIFASTVIGYIGVAIMLYGTIRALISFVHGCVFGKVRLFHVRIELGKHLALGLEFLVGKDIIESIVHPTWDDLGKLGAIIALRTIVTIFLSRELKEVEQELIVERQEFDLNRMKTAKNK